MLETSDGATLIDPYLATPKTCICERYSVSETRERGGYCTFDMSFTEVGSPGNSLLQTDTASDTNSKAQTTATSAAETVNGAETGVHSMINRLEFIEARAISARLMEALLNFPLTGLAGANLRTAVGSSWPTSIT